MGIKGFNHLEVIIKQNGDCKFIHCDDCRIKGEKGCKSFVAETLNKDMFEVDNLDYVEVAKRILKEENN